ncbi:MAG: hypothetical protein ACJLUP_03750 [Agrobacterium tumefaciens]
MTKQLDKGFSGTLQISAIVNGHHTQIGWESFGCPSKTRCNFLFSLATSHCQALGKDVCSRRHVDYQKLGKARTETGKCGTRPVHNHGAPFTEIVMNIS